MAASAKKIKTSKERRVKTPAQSHRKPGCKVCRRELESFKKPHLEDVFATQGTQGDLEEQSSNTQLSWRRPRAGSVIEMTTS